MKSAGYYRNGYLELFNVHNPEDIYDYIVARIPQLEILPQWV
jgi:hypothetical protein